MLIKAKINKKQNITHPTKNKTDKFQPIVCLKNKNYVKSNSIKTISIKANIKTK